MNNKKYKKLSEKLESVMDLSFFAASYLLIGVVIGYFIVLKLDKTLLDSEYTIYLLGISVILTCLLLFCVCVCFVGFAILNTIESIRVWKSERDKRQKER